MRKSLFYRYYLICSAIILISITVLGTVLLFFAAQYFKDEKITLLSKNVKSAVAFTAANYKSSGGQYLESNQIRTGFAIFGTSIDATMFFVDVTGQTVLCTESNQCIHKTYLISENILYSAKVNNEYSELGKLGGIYKTSYYTVGSPVIADNTVIGYVFASTPARALNAFLIEILRMFMISAAVVLMISFIIIYFVTRKMVNPLRQMSLATQSFAKGDFSVRVPVQDFDEIGQLSLAFNNMAASLSTLESMRRSFVANVSHELKTPMTSIGGFIDGILDGTIPQEKHSYYLRIVSEEVKRLSRLVKAMLNIARIEAGETNITPVSFNIVDLICQTLFNFEYLIDNKGINIEGLEGDPVYVDADKDLIHQVLYNLIENAVKFCNEGGHITFNISADGRYAYISVLNSGYGISREEIPHIFERFYKTDKSRGVDKTGVGLGLYIVKSIINLHGTDINVRSVQGEYCEFVFSLPISKNHNRFKKI